MVNGRDEKLSELLYTMSSNSRLKIRNAGNVHYIFFRTYICKSEKNIVQLFHLKMIVLFIIALYILDNLYV